MKEIFIEDLVNLIDQNITIYGWILNIRDHGKIIFIDLKDRTGIVQVVVDSSFENFNVLKSQKGASVKIEGVVKKRPENLINPSIKTGKIEIHPKKIEILSKSDVLPIPIEGDGYEISEDLRIKYRYLDLRRERMQRNLILRHKILLFIRNWLSERGFIEIETPILTKSTPEGARDYLIPSRLYPGKFYALPQSPQQYKQLLMIAGFEKYFQIARCFRDEDPRGDRQPEFTQLDIEVSWVEDQEEILSLIENLYTDIVDNFFPEKRITKKPFPRITWKEAQEKYFSDKPDLRENKNDPNELAFAFIVDFPMFEWKESEKRWDAVHHPFVKIKRNGMTKEELLEKIEKDPQSLFAFQYDFVCNGYEIGGGSLRETDIDILVKVFEKMGNKLEDIYRKFGHLIEAFKFGVPPHGGIAPGIDRLLMVLLNEPSIREVIAFPKTGEAQDLMMQSPDYVEEEKLKELKIKILD